MKNNIIYNSFNYIMVYDHGIVKAMIIGANAPFNEIPVQIAGLFVCGVAKSALNNKNIIIPKGVKVYENL